METWCFLGILFSLPHNKADVYLRTALRTSKTDIDINVIVIVGRYKSLHSYTQDNKIEIHGFDKIQSCAYIGRDIILINQIPR